MPLEEISVYMGHEDTDTTKGYIYKYNKIEKNKKTGKLDFPSFPAIFY